MVVAHNTSRHIHHGRNTLRRERQGHVARARAGTRALGALLAVVLGAAGLAGCSSTGGKRAEDRAKRLAANGSAVNTPHWTFAMVTHSGAGDTFWDIVQSGAK